MIILNLLKKPMALNSKKRRIEMKKYRFNELGDEAKQEASNNMLINHDIIYNREFYDIVEEFVYIIKEKFDVFDEKECYSIDRYENELGCCTNFFSFSHRIFDTDKVSKVLVNNVQPVCIRDELGGSIMILNQNHRWRYTGNYQDEIKENADIISLDCYCYEEILNILFNHSELKAVIIEALRVANVRLDSLMNDDVDVYDGAIWADEFDAWFDNEGNELSDEEN